MLQGINAKILRGTEQFMKYGDSKQISGYVPHGSVMAVAGGKSSYVRGAYAEEITREDIAGHYGSVIFPQSVTPKDDINYKRLILDAVTNKFISRTTGYDEFGLLSPQDELEMLKEEQGDVNINPEGQAAVLKAAPQAAEALGMGGEQQPPMAEENPLPVGAAEY